MNDKPKYVVDIHIVAAVMIGSLIAGIVIGWFWLGPFGPIFGVLAWSLYFFVGWLLEPFQSKMLRAYRADPDDNAADPIAEHTLTFLVWPAALMLTAGYIPLVLMLRVIFREDSN
jgi:hypothetical protein